MIKSNSLKATNNNLSPLPLLRFTTMPLKLHMLLPLPQVGRHRDKVVEDRWNWILIKSSL